MYGEAPKELYLSKEQKVKKMSEIVPNGYTKIDYQKKADWQKNPTREYKWKNSDYVYNNHDYLERKGI